MPDVNVEAYGRRYEDDEDPGELGESQGQEKRLVDTGDGFSFYHTYRPVNWSNVPDYITKSVTLSNTQFIGSVMMAYVSESSLLFFGIWKIMQGEVTDAIRVLLSVAIPYVITLRAMIIWLAVPEVWPRDTIYTYFDVFMASLNLFRARDAYMVARGKWNVNNLLLLQAGVVARILGLPFALAGTAPKLFSAESPSMSLEYVLTAAIFFLNLLLISRSGVVAHKLQLTKDDRPTAEFRFWNLEERPRASIIWAFGITMTGAMSRCLLAMLLAQLDVMALLVYMLLGGLMLASIANRDVSQVLGRRLRPGFSLFSTLYGTCSWCLVDYGWLEVFPTSAGAVNWLYPTRVMQYAFGFGALAMRWDLTSNFEPVAFWTYFALTVASTSWYLFAYAYYCFYLERDRRKSSFHAAMKLCSRWSHAPSVQKEIVIIGGGWSSMFCQSMLSGCGHNVTVISDVEWWENTLGGAYALFYPSKYTRTVAGKGYPLSEGVRRIVDTAVGLDGNSVLLKTGGRKKFDALIVAVGFNSGPLKHKVGQSFSERKKEVESIGAAAKNAKVIVIAGAGAAGLELAGNAREVNKTARIIILAKDEGNFLKGVSEGIRRNFQKSCKNRKIEVLYDRVDASIDGSALPVIGSQTLKLASGSEIETDLYLPSFLESFAAGFCGDLADGFGRVRVNDFLQSTVRPDIFAVGCSDKEFSILFKVAKQARTASFNACFYLNNEPLNAHYDFLPKVQAPFALISGHHTFAQQDLSSFPSPIKECNACCINPQYKICLCGACCSTLEGKVLATQFKFNYLDLHVKLGDLGFGFGKPPKKEDPPLQQDFGQEVSYAFV